MDSADHHQHGASAAPPPKATPLPEPSATKGCNAKAVAAATTQKEPTTKNTSKTSLIAPMSSSCTTTKKRPLASVSSASTSTEASSIRKDVLAAPSVPIHKNAPPVLKKNFRQDSKITATKAKKTVTKKKKRKFSSILSGMMKPKKTMDISAAREAIREGLGGGNFSKVEKI